jgi:pimeloyl-ACP methyl ester carboxylesterase
MKTFARAMRGRRLGRWGLAALALAASAVLIHRKSRAVEAEYPPLGTFLDVDGVRLHVWCAVKASRCCCSRQWQQRARSQALGFTGARGRALSGHRNRPPRIRLQQSAAGTVWTPQAQARLIHRALAQLGIVRPIVAAHSLGTQVALALALEFPDDVRSLALLSGLLPSLRPDLALSTPAMPLIGRCCDTLAPWIGRLIGRCNCGGFLSGRVTPSFRAYPRGCRCDPALRATAAESALAPMAAAALRRHYRELTVPVVILAGGGRSLHRPWLNSVRLHRELPTSELTLAPGAGHMVHHIVPEEVMTAIDAASAAPWPIDATRPSGPSGRTGREQPVEVPAS